MPLHYRKDEGFRLKCILSHNRDLILVQVALVQHVCLHWHLFLKGFFFFNEQLTSYHNFSLNIF